MPQTVADFGRVLCTSPQTDPKKVFLDSKPISSFNDVLARSSSTKYKTPDTKLDAPKKPSDRTDAPDKKADQSDTSEKSDKPNPVSIGKNDKANPNKKPQADHLNDDDGKDQHQDKTDIVEQSPFAAIAITDEQHTKSVKHDDKAVEKDKDNTDDDTDELNAIAGAVTSSDAKKTAPTDEKVSAADASAISKSPTQAKPTSTSTDDPSADANPVPSSTVPVKPEAKAKEFSDHDSDDTASIPIPGFEKADDSDVHLATQDHDQSTDFLSQLQNNPAHKIADKSPIVQTHIAPEQKFAADNVDKIVTSVRTELVPNGGTMKMHLHPQDLGSLEITVKMQDGTLSASFETTNDDATRLLSHNLEQLKTTLESAGVNVDRIQVKQSSSSDSSSNQQSNDSDRQQQPQDHSARQEQQRKEMLQRMWRKLAFGNDEVDLVA